MTMDQEDILIKSPVELWRYDKPKETMMWAFMQRISEKFGLSISSYEHLYNWSITDIENFWQNVWEFTDIISSKPADKVIDKDVSDDTMFPRPEFFKGAKLSYAENLLFPNVNPDENSTAIVSVNEFEKEFITWRELRERVRKLSCALRNFGIKPGDRVVGYVSNNATTLITLLAVSAVGGVWSSTSSEIGVTSVVERLSQIEPVILFADNASIYNQKTFDNLPKVAEIVSQLDSLKAVVITEVSSTISIDLERLRPKNGDSFTLTNFISNVQSEEPLIFEQLDFDHPLFILYSSGTTGKPKCIVHGQGGTLIQHKKEHFIHMDMHVKDVFFQYTTCSWMMWQWLISGLASGATLVLYDGSPFQPNGEASMFKLIDELNVKYFGTSAKYLSILEQKNYMPKETYPMESLSMITSTGSVLSPSTFDYVYRAFGPILLGSITGGTDIISLFGAPNYTIPVYKGEVQCRGLGMAVEVWDQEGNNIGPTGEAGDLVCTKVFPCMPVMFWNDPNGDKYRASYFERFGNKIWHHGDYVRLSPKTGGMVMLGRSDGVLKPSGVRFGSSEIYNVINKDFASQIDDSVCVGMRRATDTDEIVVLFVKMHPSVQFNNDLVTKIKKAIREQLSARHVPAIIDETPEIPFTANGKKTETIVKNIISRSKVKIGASVANAECLPWYEEWAQKH
ncbi:hypothetical protein V1511DRAFT_492319 [Dipodascopsis uninucleata]